MYYISPVELKIGSKIYGILQNRKETREILKDYKVNTPSEKVYTYKLVKTKV